MTHPLTHHWYTALAQPQGSALRVEPSEAVRAIQALYRARESAADAILHTISIQRSPTDPGLIFLLRDQPDLSDLEVEV